MRNGRKIGRKTRICANANEFEAALREWNESIPLLLQKYIVGVGEGVFGLATPEGVQAWSAHRRLRMMNPQGSGASACVSIPVDQCIRQKTEALIRNAKWTGLFMVELLRDRSGEAWFVELNGRPWGSMALARRQGLEYPAWSASMALSPGSHVGTAKCGYSRTSVPEPWPRTYVPAVRYPWPKIRGDGRMAIVVDSSSHNPANQPQ